MIQKLSDDPRTDLIPKPFDAEQTQLPNIGTIRNILCVKWENSANKQETIVAIGINPSTAHTEKSDTTITKLCRFLDMYGFNNLTMLNLYENVSSTQLNSGEKKITDFNTKRKYLDDADIILIVWGVDDKKDLRLLKNNAKEVLKDYSKKLYCIETDSRKSPAHPSRLRYRWNIVPYHEKNS